MAQRRPRGSGSIYYEEAYDRYAITWQTADGKSNKRRIRGSRIDAERELRAELAKADAGAPKVDRRMTLDAWLTTWLDTYVEGKSIGTRRRYRDITDRLIRPSLGRIKLTDLSDTDVARLKAKLVRDGHNRRGADAILDVLSAALGQAVRSRILHQNVRTRVPRELSTIQPRHVPTREETERMLAAVADQPRWYALYALTIGHGLRQSETLGLQWGDRSADGRDITIARKAEYQTRRLDEEPKDFEHPHDPAAALGGRRARCIGAGSPGRAHLPVAQWAAAPRAQPVEAHPSAIGPAGPALPLRLALAPPRVRVARPCRRDVDGHAAPDARPSRPRHDADLPPRRGRRG